MEISTSYSSRSIAEMEAANRKWHYWPRMVAGNLRLIIYLVAGLFVGGQRIIKGWGAQPTNSHDTGVGFAIIAGVCGVGFLVVYLREMKQRKAIRKQGALKLNLEATGITSFDAIGGSSFEPWTSFSGFRWGKSIAVLTRPKPDAPRIIPFDSLTMDEAGSLRSTLLGHLPEAV